MRPGLFEKARRYLSAAKSLNGYAEALSLMSRDKNPEEFMRFSHLKIPPGRLSISRALDSFLRTQTMNYSLFRRLHEARNASDLEGWIVEHFGLGGRTEFSGFFAGRFFSFLRTRAGSIPHEKILKILDELNPEAVEPERSQESTPVGDLLSFLQDSPRRLPLRRKPGHGKIRRPPP